MRYTEFLLEYDRSREQTRIEAVPTYQTRQKQDPGFSLEKLESADPTPQKIYVPRLATWWLAGEPTEDLISTTADALAKYHALKIKKKLKSEHADIGRFRTADQFTDVLSQYTLPGDAAPLDRGKYTEIHRDGQLIVVQLLDKTAAQWWGKSTKWCTAAQNNNQFARYATKGPLYVIVDRVNNTRYQLWWDQKDAYQFQFMDVRDRRFNPAQLPFYHQLRPIFAPLHPHLMWQTNPTPADQLAGVRQNSDAIQWITNPTPEAQLAAVRQNSDAIRLITNPTLQAQLAAVQAWGGAIKYIINPTEQVQLAAVGQNGVAIEHISNPSVQVQLAAVEQRGEAIYWIQNPTKQVQLAAVEQRGYVIRYIPNPSLQVQLAAVQQIGAAIEHISNPSVQVQLAAVGQNGWAIEYITNPTEQVQLAAVEQNPGAIYYIKNPTPAVQALARQLKKNK